MSGNPVVFPDVELWACDFLRAQLPDFGQAGVFVSNRRENQAKAVWVRRDGGPSLDQFRETARLGINVFAATEKAVADLAAVVSAVLRFSPDGQPVLRVTQQSGPSSVEDTHPRRYMTFEVTVRGTELEPTP